MNTFDGKRLTLCADVHCPHRGVHYLNCLDVAKIDQELYLRMGGEDVQNAIREKFGRGVFYIEKIVQWERPSEPGEPAYLAGVGVLAR